MSGRTNQDEPWYRLLEKKFPKGRAEERERLAQHFKALCAAGYPYNEFETLYQQLIASPFLAEDLLQGCKVLGEAGFSKSECGVLIISVMDADMAEALLEVFLEFQNIGFAFIENEAKYQDVIDNEYRSYQLGLSLKEFRELVLSGQLTVADLIEYNVTLPKVFDLILKNAEKFKMLAEDIGIDRLFSLGARSLEGLQSIFKLFEPDAENAKFQIIDLQDKVKYLFVPDLTIEEVTGGTPEEIKELISGRLSINDFSLFKAAILESNDIVFDNLWEVAGVCDLQDDVIVTLLAASKKITDYPTPFTKKIRSLTGTDPEGIMERPKTGFLETVTSTYGVEIECLVSSMGSEIKSAPGFDHYMQGRDRNSFQKHRSVMEKYFPKSSPINEKFSTSWSAVADSSVRPDRDDSIGIEFVSPVLGGGSDIVGIEQACEIIKLMDGYTNDTCGLHVHVGIVNKFEETDQLPIIKQVLINYISIESGVSFPKREFKMPNYSEVLEYYEHVIDDVINIDTVADLIQFIYLQRDQAKVNLESLAKHGTLEFREHPGTIEYSDIKSWIEFIDGFMGKSVEMALSDEGPHLPNNVESHELNELVKVLKQNNSKIIGSSVEPVEPKAGGEYDPNI